MPISKKEDLVFKDVCYYLDGVGIETLVEFSNDIDEILVEAGAAEEITPNMGHAPRSISTLSITARVFAVRLRFRICARSFFCPANGIDRTALF